MTCGCFRPWSGSGKCIANLLKHHFVFLALFGFVQLNKYTACQKYKVMFQQIHNPFARPNPGLEASTRHSKKLSVFDGVNKNKCMGDIVGTLVTLVTPPVSC